MEGEHPVPARYPGAAARSPSTSGHRSVAEGAREAVATSLGALGPWLLGRVGTEWEFLELPRGFYRSCPLHTPMTIPGRWARRGAGVLPCTRSSPSPPPNACRCPPHVQIPHRSISRSIWAPSPAPTVRTRRAAVEEGGARRGGQLSPPGTRWSGTESPVAAPPEGLRRAL